MNWQMCTDLRSAIKVGDPNAVRSLLESYGETADQYINHRDRYDATCLFTACCEGNVQIVDLLLSFGGNVHIKSASKSGLLHIACSAAKSDVVKLLLHKGISPNDQDCLGNTPLMIAVADSSYSVVSMLMMHGVNSELTNKYDLSALALACKGGDLRMVNQLLSFGFKIEESSKNSPLYIATMSHHIEIVKKLIERGANVNECVDGCSLLVRFVSDSFSNSVDVIDMLETLWTGGLDISEEFNPSRGHSTLKNLIVGQNFVWPWLQKVNCASS